MPSHCYSSVTVTVRRGTLESLNAGIWLHCMVFLLLGMLCLSAIFSSSNAFMIFFFSFLFVLVIFLWAFIPYTTPTAPKKKTERKKNPNPSKLQTLRMLNVKFPYTGSQAEPFALLIFIFIPHMYCPKFWFPSHKTVCSKKQAVQCVVF